LRRWQILLGIALVAIIAGAFDLERTQIQIMLAHRLEYELRGARERGHPVFVLITDGAEAEVRAEAEAFQRVTGSTVLAVTEETALVVPSPADLRYATAEAWSVAVSNAASAFLYNDDLNGAAAVVVRLYTNELVRRGVLPALPPRPPIFMPDIERHPDFPNEAALLGMGIMLGIFSAYGLLMSRRARARNPAPAS
jgi:hypothetical protein